MLPARRLVTKLSHESFEPLNEKWPDHLVWLALIAYADPISGTISLSQRQVSDLTGLSATDVQAAYKVLQWRNALERLPSGVYMLDADRERHRRQAFGWRMRAEPQWREKQAILAQQKLDEARAKEQRYEAYRAEQLVREREWAEQERARLTVTDGERRFLLSLSTWVDRHGYVDGPRLGEIVTYSGLSYEDAKLALKSLSDRNIITLYRAYSGPEKNRYRLNFAITDDWKKAARAQVADIDSRLEPKRRERERFVTLDREQRMTAIWEHLAALGDSDGTASIVVSEYADFGVASQKQLFHFLFALQAENVLAVGPKDPSAPNVVTVKLDFAAWERRRNENGGG